MSACDHCGGAGGWWATAPTPTGIERSAWVICFDCRGKGTRP